MGRASRAGERENRAGLVGRQATSASPVGVRHEAPCREVEGSEGPRRVAGPMADAPGAAQCTSGDWVRQFSASRDGRLMNDSAAACSRRTCCSICRSRTSSGTCGWWWNACPRLLSAKNCCGASSSCGRRSAPLGLSLGADRRHRTPWRSRPVRTCSTPGPSGTSSSLAPHLRCRFPTGRAGRKMSITDAARGGEEQVWCQRTCYGFCPRFRRDSAWRFRRAARLSGPHLTGWQSARGPRLAQRPGRPAFGRFDAAAGVLSVFARRSKSPNSCDSDWREPPLAWLSALPQPSRSCWRERPISIRPTTSTRCSGPPGRWASNRES